MQHFPITIFVDDNLFEIHSEQEWNDFSEEYIIIHAAGGIVKDDNGNFLMIFRLNKWDFPKGKVENEESYSQTALREVYEETNLSNLKLIRELPNTFHTYELDSKQILKITHWYLMSCLQPNELIPQKEEGISDVRWIKYSDVSNNLKKSYHSLRFLWKKSQSLL